MAKKNEEKLSTMDRLDKGREGVDWVISFVDWVRGVFDWLRGLVNR